VPLLPDVDVLEVGLGQEHGDVADGVAEGLQLDQAVELEDGPLLSVRREGNVNLVRLGLAADLAADLDHRRDAQVQGPTLPHAPDLVAADAPGVFHLLFPALVVIAVGPLGRCLCFSHSAGDTSL
jgi:hypothetical protein